MIDSVEHVAIRDRAAETTLLVAEPASSHPAVSGDGCVIAYLVAVPADPADASSAPAVELRAVDRCAAPAGPLAGGVLLHTLADAAPSATPAVSADGTVVVWSTGASIARFTKFTNAEGVVIYVEDGGFDPIADAVALGVLPAEADIVTGPDVDVADGARVVAFVAGPGLDPYAPAPPDVYVWSADPAGVAPPTVELASMPASSDPAEAKSPPEAGSSGPVLSRDGAIVLFESSDTDLAAVAATPDAVTPFVVMYERGVGTGVLDYGAKRPAISADGHHAVYDRGGAIWAVRWSTGSPFGSVSSGAVVGAPDDAASASVTGAVISAHGRSIVFDIVDGAELTDDTRFHTGTHVWLWRQSEELHGADVNLGSIDVPGRQTGRATITNGGAAGFPVGSVVLDAPFSLVATDCAGVLQPGLSCTVDVAADITAAGEFDGLIRVLGGTPPTEFSVAVTATGIDPAATSSTTTTTSSSSTSSTTTSTSSTTTTPPRTVPTVPPRTVPPRTVPPRTTPPTTRPPRVTTTITTTTTTTLPLPAVFNPPSFEFAPTIVDAGRRTATVDLFNPAQQTRTVVALGIEPVAGTGFVVDGSACLGQSIAQGGFCTVGLEFAPTAEGPLSATITADFADGSRSTLVVSGVGAPPPTLTVAPGVASNGQVFTVLGAGFPAGGTVELSWYGGRVARAPVVDAVGGFAETLVVLPNTPGGHSEIVVAGQVDVFADVTADLLVSAAGNRSNVALFGGLGPSVAR